MKPKKYIALFVALIMLGSLVGCGANTSSNEVSPEELEQPDIIIDVTDSKEDSPESTTSNSTTEANATEAITRTDELIQHLITISDEAKALYEANN